METSTFRKNVSVSHALPERTLGGGFSLLRVSPEAPLYGFILSPQPLWLETHWLPARPGVKGRTVPHLSDQHLCEGCTWKGERKWTCFLAFLLMPDEKRVIAEVTCGAADGTPLARGEMVRGRHLQLHRKKARSTGRASKFSPVGILFGPQQFKGKLPGDFDVLDSLLRIWRYLPTRSGITVYKLPTEGGGS